MRKDSPEMSALLSWIQFAYMSRSPFRAGKQRSHQEIETGAPPKEGFLFRLCDNVKGMALPENLEMNLLALAVSAYGEKPDRRQSLCAMALDAIEILFPSVVEKLQEREAGATEALRLCWDAAVKRRQKRRTS